jgi:hypothetical protein
MIMFACRTHNIVCGESFHHSHDQPPQMPLFWRRVRTEPLFARCRPYARRAFKRNLEPKALSSQPQLISTNTQAGFHRLMHHDEPRQFPWWPSPARCCRCCGRGGRRSHGGRVCWRRHTCQIDNMQLDNGNNVAPVHKTAQQQLSGKAVSHVSP